MDVLLDRWLAVPGLREGMAHLGRGGLLSLEVSDAGKPVLIGLLRRALKRPVCVLASTVSQQEHLYSEVEALSVLWGGGAGSITFFPELEFGWDPARDEKALPDFETLGETIRILMELREPSAPSIVITTSKGYHQRLPSGDTLEKSICRIAVGDRMGIEAMLESLIRLGYEREGLVVARGQLSRRGGIVDFFPFQAEAPVRIEFFGDEVESLRVFDPDTQASVQSVSEFSYTGMPARKDEGPGGTLKDYLQEGFLLWQEPEKRDGKVRLSFHEASGDERELHVGIFAHDFLISSGGDMVLREQRQENLLRHWISWHDKEKRDLLVCCHNDGEERRLKEILSGGGEAEAVGRVSRAHWLRSPLMRGFSWPDAGCVVLSDSEIFDRYQTLRMARMQQKVARARARREVLDFSQFNEGDYVVHVQHGIARFLGVRKVDVHGREQEVLSLEYEGGALLHVPLEQAHLVGRYVGVGKAIPTLDQLGGKRWEKATIQAQQAVMDYAAKLLRIHAEREANTGFAFGPDNEWQREFEDAFLFPPTPDQQSAIQDTKRNMELPEPMDRLICGDVGFGKTEVAMRAAFKAVMNGRQVAVLTPTTVLAQQHERTFKERMADYPVRIDLLSRFRTKAQQRKTLEAVRTGEVDIVIGTHRLLQPDIHFKNLGLVIVDEEQRFGVKHKERFKEIFKLIDVLTLSATPIPRTLYLALMGAKDISTIETPPPNRLPVETVIAPYDERLIRSAIERELARGGQVYFLHNRVQSIQKVRDRIKELVPAARVELGHGQMDADDLEAVMMRFVAGEMDVLVATTIIESGLDIPRANTILIDRADRFGLADLYQLRGRVGRSRMKAYAYLLLPRHLMIEGHARKRVSAIKQYSQLGAGFKIAMRDLEIRGAGNILGTEQSGHAAAIGFELYCQLLKETLARMKGEKVPPRIEVSVRLDFLPMSEDHAEGGVGAFIPRAYMSENRQRIEAYRKLAEAATEADLKALAGLWTDRFGKPPLAAALLLELGRIRIQAARNQIQSIEVEEGKVMMKRRGAYVLDGSKFPRLKQEVLKDPMNALERIQEIVRLGTEAKDPPSKRTRMQKASG